MDLPGSQSKQQIDRCSTRLQFCTRNLRGTELSRTSDPAQLTFAPQAPVLKQCRPRGCFSAVPGQSFGLAWLRRRFGLGLHFRSWLLGVDPLNRPVCTVHTAQSTPCPACCSVCSLPTLTTLSTRSLGSCQPTAARSPHPRARSRSSLSPSPFHSIVSSHLRHSTPPTPRHPLFPSRPSTSFSCRLSFVFCGRPVLPLEYYIHSICVFFFPFPRRFRDLLLALRFGAAIARRRRNSRHHHRQSSRQPISNTTRRPLRPPPSVSRRRDRKEEEEEALDCWDEPSRFQALRAGPCRPFDLAKYRLKAATGRETGTPPVDDARPHANLDCRTRERAAAETKHMRPLRRRLVSRPTTNPGCESNSSTV